MASNALEANNKDVAAVLAAAALEDSMKKLGLLHGMGDGEKELSAVSNFLKSKGIVKGAQSSLMSGYVTLRNKAFHAQWDKIEKAEVASMISFTKELILKHF